MEDDLTVSMRRVPKVQPEWQGILPVYWNEDLLNKASTIKLYYLHSGCQTPSPG